MQASFLDDADAGAVVQDSLSKLVLHTIRYVSVPFWCPSLELSLHVVFPKGLPWRRDSLKAEDSFF